MMMRGSRIVHQIPRVHPITSNNFFEVPKFYKTKFKIFSSSSFLAHSDYSYTNICSKNSEQPVAEAITTQCANNSSKEDIDIVDVPSIVDFLGKNPMREAWSWMYKQDLLFFILIDPITLKMKCYLTIDNNLNIKVKFHIAKACVYFLQTT